MYIKLFEEYHTEDYLAISEPDFYSSVWGEDGDNESCEPNFIENNWDIFSDQEFKEIKKVLPEYISSWCINFTSHFRNRRYLKIDVSEESEFIKKPDGGSVPSLSEIFKLKDEWFFVEISDNVGNQFHFKCDQMSGLKKLLKEFFV